MKNRILLLVMGSLLVFFTVDIAPADYWIEFDPQLHRILGGAQRRGSFRTRQEAEKWRQDFGRKYNDLYFLRHSSVKGFKAPASKISRPWGATAPAGGFSSSEQFAVQAFSSLLGSLMREVMTPPPQVDTSYQQQEAEAAKIKQKELKRQKAWQQWREFQEKEASERAEKEKQNRELLAKMQLLGSEEPLRMESMAGSKLEAFKLGRPEAGDLELQALGRGRYDTSTLSSWQRLLCAAHFSSEALIAIKNGDEETARYLNEQAEKVSSGQMIELECKFPALPQPPEPEKAESRMAAYVNLLEKTQKDIKTLQDIEIKIKQTEVKKKQAESKKAKAEKMIAESHALDTAKPEDKAKAKSLKDQAQILLQEAQNEIELANETHKELLTQQAEIQNELKQMQEEIESKDEVN